MRIVLASLLLVIPLLSGCAEDGRSSLLSIYPGSDKTDTGQLLLNGTILEARIGDGAWSMRPTFMIEVPAVSTPAMTTPMPQGGGASTLDIPLELNVTVEARLLKHERLAGYTAYWSLLPLGAFNGTQGLPALAVHEAPANGMLTTTLPGPGVYVLVVSLDAKSGLDLVAGDEPQAVGFSFAEIFVGAHIQFSGEVQPVRPGSGTGVASPPSTTPTANMQDVYRFTLGSSAPLSVTTRHNGGPADSLGTDIDVGFFDPNDAPVMCEGAGGAPTAPSPAPDPAQAEESLAYVAMEAGTWSLVIGAMPDGCGGTAGWYYNNAEPVPYAGDLYIGFAA